MGVDEATSADARPRLLRRLLREPLLHFLLIGALLFAVFDLRHGVPGTNPTRIEVTEADLQRLERDWIAKQGRPPTPEEMQGLVDAEVREEVLYREALALRLDRGDTVVKQRLAQKMEFLTEDVTDLEEPTSETLRAWFEKNPQRFTLPPRVTFRHVFFSPEKRGEAARADATQAMDELANGSDAPALGDAFIFKAAYADRSPDEVAGIFGTAFAQTLFALEPGAWRGPVESDLGWHLVFVDSIAPGGVLAFEAVEPDVQRAWIEDRRAELKRQAFEAMKARYQIVVAERKEAKRE